jgi:hypothetical protein
MATFKEISANDIKTARSFLNQLVDVIQEDVSGSSTRRKFQVFVTGGVGPGVTSSLFQTVYDQNFSLQTANPVMDFTAGLYVSGNTVQNIKTGEDTAGKLLFPSTSLMMREKVDIYQQYAQVLLGDSAAQFVAPFNSTSTGNASSAGNDSINEALFVNFKRLFARDQIKRETFALKFYQTASADTTGYTGAWIADGNLGTNTNVTAESGSAIFTDVGSAANKLTTFGGNVSNIVDSANTARTVGLLFNDYGTAIFDLAKIISGTQKVSGTISAMSIATTINGDSFAAGTTLIGTATPAAAGGNPRARFIPDFMTSGSMDNIIDHFASCRFSSGTLTAMTFQNITNINSSLIFCRATADEFNYSSNVSYTDADNRIRVIDEGQEDAQRSFTFVTSVGMYDANDNLLAVAKLSRPVEKNDEKDVTFRIRLDF